MSQYDRDIIIIGAGLLGCAAARSLRRYDLSVTVLEKASDVCTGISKGNSGIIYAGYDDRPGSLKAQMVVRACERLPELCRELDVRYRKTGSMMFGYGPRSERIIREKYEQGLANGVPGLELISGEEAMAREPLLAKGVRIGLYAPGTATLDPWELCIALYENARANGAEFRMDSEVTSISRTDGGFIVQTAGRKSGADSPDAHSEGACYRARALINCAGLGSDTVRDMVFVPAIRIEPNASDYFVLGIPEGSGPGSVIFHEPEYKGKGLTLIPTVNGEILAGSTQRKEPDLEGNPTSEEGLRHIMDLCSEVVPGMPVSPVIHSFAAVRPNPFDVRDEDRRLHDFTILEEDGMISLMGIKTPGLTCCVELGEYVTDHIIEYLNNNCTGADDPDRLNDSRPGSRHDRIKPDPDHDSRRRGIRRFADIPAEELADEVSREPELGHIICTCRKVSEYEIREAVKRGATTLDGVKRRTGVLMGKCQGSKCLSAVLHIMADELDVDLHEIVRDTQDSAVIRQDRK